MNAPRILFLALIFANAVLFAWWQGYLAPWGPGSAREPQRLAAQVAPEKLTLIAPESATPEKSASEPAPAAADTAAANAASTSTPTAEPTAAPGNTPAPANAAQANTCLWVDGLKETDLKALLKDPTPRPGLTLTTKDVERPAGYQVAIRGLASQAAAQAKQNEVKALGVDLPSAIKSDGDTFRLILARAPDQASAEAALAKLQEQGVRSARVVTLPIIKVTRLQVTGTEAAFQPLTERFNALGGITTSACEAR